MLMSAFSDENDIPTEKHLAEMSEASSLSNFIVQYNLTIFRQGISGIWPYVTRINV